MEFWVFAADAEDTQIALGWLAKLSGSPKPTCVVSHPEVLCAKIADQRGHDITLVVGPTARALWNQCRDACATSGLAAVEITGDLKQTPSSAKNPSTEYHAVFTRIAHDLRGHASVIGGALRELAQSIDKESKEQTLIALSTKGVQRLTRLAGLTTLLMSIENNEGTTDVFNLKDLLMSAVTEALTIEGRKGVEIHTTIPESAFVKAHASNLRIAIQEIIINALRHARSDVRVTVKNENGESSICVEDNGPGFQKGRETVALDRFAQIEGRVCASMGLWLARDAIEAHQGSLQIESLPSGTKVSITLPSSSTLR